MSTPWRIRIVVAIFVVALVAVAVLATDTGDDSEPGETEPDREEIVSPDELSEAAADNDFPIYWAGEIEGHEIHLTLFEGVSALVTYLDDEAQQEPETAAATSLAIGSYPMEDPAAAIALVAGEDGAVMRESEEGRTVVTNRASPNSVYFVPPGEEMQVEVYDPDPRRAMAIALSDQVKPVD